MVRLKLPARRRELATDAPGDPGPSGPSGQSIYDQMLANEALQREQQQGGEAVAAVLQAEENARAAPPAVVARRAVNFFEEAIEELGPPMPPMPPMPPDRMPVAVQASDLRGSARRLVCRDRATMKSANTWDTFKEHSVALQQTRNYRRKQRPTGIWPSTEKKTRSSFARAEKEVKDWADDFEDLFKRQPTVSEFEKKEQEVTNQRMPELYVTSSLPSYKCVARALTLDENEQLKRDRDAINKAREDEKGDHRHFDTSFKWTGELETLARMVGPPMYTKENASSDIRITYNNLRPEYDDFMNEERRAILSTIRGATARLGRKEVSIRDLEEQERIEALAEYAPLFKNGERDDLVLAKSESVVVYDLEPDGKPKERRVCHGTPETNFDDPDARDPQSDATKGGDDAVRKREEDAKDFVEARVPFLGEDGKVDKTGPKDVAKQKLNRGGIIYKEVKALTDENDCEPCKEWAFPAKGPQPGNGYYQAIRRALEVNNQMGNQGTKGSKNEDKGSTLSWPYFGSFMNDPFLRYHTGNGRDTPLEYVIDKLFLKYNAQASKARTKRSVLQTELLRCFPEKMPAGSNRLNSILDFTCWWHVNITREGVEVFTKRGGASKSMAARARDSRVYLALCCPNCEGKRYPGEELSLYKLRSNLHVRVGMLRSYMEQLKFALDEDVLKGEPKDSILWNYKADTDPAANADVRQELYEGWKRLNPVQ